MGPAADVQRTADLPDDRPPRDTAKTGYRLVRPIPERHTRLRTNSGLLLEGSRQHSMTGKNGVRNR